MPDKFEDECGVVGVYNHPDAVNLAALGLLALQHRGHESAGIAYRHRGIVRGVKTMGSVGDLIRRELSGLVGSAAIGHVRYSTAGSSSIVNAQPILVSTAAGSVATCHNGNLVNAEELRAELAQRGIACEGDSDTEVIARMFAERWPQLADEVAFRSTFEPVRGAYSVAMLTRDRLFALRDPLGIRPLSLGQLGDAIVIASESCAFDAMGASFVRDVRPAELVMVSASEIRSVPFQRPAPQAAQCIFELVYFSRPDSVVFGQNVAEVRMAFGARLAQDAPVDADIVVPIPESGLYSAIGYARGSGIPFELALFKNSAVGRTFIEPHVPLRRAAIASKFNPIGALVGGRRVVLVDDSLVRGFTCRSVVAKLREAGAREVHLRIASPPTIAPCYFGVDTPDEAELLAARQPIEQIVRMMDADSLAYLSFEGMLASAGLDSRSYCTGCYTHQYPVDVGLVPFSSRRSILTATAIA